MIHTGELTSIVGMEVFDIEEQTYDTNVWEACWDNDTSRIYFYNRVTGLSQWEEPPIM